MQYKVEELKIVDVLNRISIPNYQRHLVWPKKNKKKFIESLILEYPIGVITAYEQEELGSKKMVIIDGLQRLSTINQFFSKPSSIIKYSELVKMINIEIKDSHDGLTNSQNKFIHNYFQKWYDELEDINLSLDTSEYKFMARIQSNYNEMFCDSDLTDLADRILLRFNSIVKAVLFMESSIPFIICVDIDDEELPVVFESMNTGSVKLSKYEIYVSQWHNYGPLELADEQIKKEIILLKKTRYQEIFNQSVEDLEPEQLMDFNTIYLQDILIYYSKEMYEWLGISKKRSDEIGFEILALVCINKVYGINTLVVNQFLDDKCYIDTVGDYVVSVFQHIMSLITDERISFNSVHKFKKYYKLAVLFKMTTELNLNELIINTTSITDEMVSFIDAVNDDFDSQRQVSYLHSLIMTTTQEFIGNNVIESTIPTAKVVNVTHAGRPHPEDKLRIQIVPSRLRGDRNRGIYSEIFGVYKSDKFNYPIYVKFNFEHAIDSNAKNKSIYVQYEDLMNFYNLKETHIVDVDEFVDELMTEEIFDTKYIRN